MNPSAMVYDHQLLLVIMVRMPAAVVAAMAMAPQIASWRDGFWGGAVARMIMIAPVRRPRVMSTCAARNTVVALWAVPLAWEGRPRRLTAIPSRNWEIERA